jgi:serine/threonine kinase 32
MPCLHAISSLLEKDKTLRIGSAGFDTFTDNPFFRELDFDALLAKEIEPIFCPSSEKTNFDATYDLEELLLEEAPLEARARKQKPRAELRDDATPQEIRADELHRMVETMFEPFNYTLVPETRDPAAEIDEAALAAAAANDKTLPIDALKQHDKDRSTPPPRSQTPGNASRTRSSTRSDNGSPTNYSIPPQGPPPQSDLPPIPPIPSDPSARTTRTVRYEDTTPSAQPSTSRNQPRPRGSTRSTSMGGGVQVVLNEQGSWSDMANQSREMVDGERDGKRAERSPGMLGLFSRKKGRDRSPKGKEKERGVLGKEGARVVISHG